jgi:alpha-amylase
MWLAERVWEPDLPRDIAEAGIDYVVVDDYHLRAAGVTDEQIIRPYRTGWGDRGVTVIGGSEQLRYTIPYLDPEATVTHLRDLDRLAGGRQILVTMADDGEKFGVWPGTFQRVYQEKWLDKLLTLIEQESPWLRMTTFADALAEVPPEETVFIPTVSYMEMSEWSLPTGAQPGYVAVRDLLADRADLGYTKHLVRGGFWRGFLGKYPESRYLNLRAWRLSERIHEALRAAPGDVGLLTAREELWQAQCNDAYWHGVFGGLYLPFLRAALWNHLCRAEALADTGRTGVCVETADFDGDGRDELLLRSPALTVSIDPENGAVLELCHRATGLNFSNTLTRTEEAYHHRIEALALKMAGEADPGSARSIHDVEKIRDGGAPPAVFHDAYRRLSFVDHRADELPDPVDWRSGALAATAPAYTAVDVSPEAPGDVVLAGPGGSAKRFTVEPAEAVIRCRVAPGAGTAFVGQEFNFTPTSIDEAVLTITCAGVEKTLRPPFEAQGVTAVRLADPHSGVTLSLSSPVPLVAWADRVCTVSNSEAGYEEIPQQIALLVWQPAKFGEMDVTVSFAQNGQAVPGIS